MATGVVEVHSVFTPEPASVGAARRFVRNVLHQWGTPEVADVASLLTSELATNALMHARSPFRVAIRETVAGVRVAVHDRSPALPHVKDFGADAAVGRGLPLLDDLCSAWGVTAGGRDYEAKSVWFHLATAGPVGAGGPSARRASDVQLALDEVELSAPWREDDELVDVLLVDLPLDVYRRSQQHSEELARELRLIASAPEEAESVPRRLRRLIYELAARYGPLNPGARRHLRLALERGEARTDVLYRVPRRSADDVQALDALLREADEHCRAGGGLLTLATPPEALAFREWVFGEIVGQIGGAEPRPWTVPEPG